MTEKPLCRVFVSETLKEDVCLIPKSDRCHYIRAVMRAKKDDPIAVFNSRDGDWLARVIRADKKGWSFLFSPRIRPPRGRAPLTHGFCSPP